MLSALFGWGSPATKCAFGEEWTVTSPEGVAVREGCSLCSPFVQILAQWEVVRVLDVIRGRARLSSPPGWVSIASDDGTTLLSQAEPSTLCCPISSVLFRDPVLVPLSGHTYERSSLELFWDNSKGGSRDQGWPRDPMTNVQLMDTTVYPNLVIRHQVQEWLKENPERLPEGWADLAVPAIHVWARTSEGARFGGFSIGQRICAAHTIVLSRDETPIKKGDTGVFKGPILPFDRAVAEGVAQITWDSRPQTKSTVNIRDIASMDKRLSILKRQLQERHSKGVADEDLEQQVAHLSKATAEREDILDRIIIEKLENFTYASEGRVWEVVQAALKAGTHNLHEEDIGVLHKDNFKRALKKLVKLSIVEKYSARTRVGARVFRICKKPQNTARMAATASVLALLALASPDMPTERETETAEANADAEGTDVQGDKTPQPEEVVTPREADAEGADNVDDAEGETGIRL